MNWKEIKEKCPKAWERLLEWKDYLEIHDDGTIGWHFNATPVHSHLVLWRTYELRNFWDFFDENKIFISIEHNSDEPMCFDWYIWTEGITAGNHQIPLVYEKRENAEISAFTKAFEILEEKL